MLGIRNKQVIMDILLEYERQFSKHLLLDRPVSVLYPGPHFTGVG